MKKLFLMLTVVLVGIFGIYFWWQSRITISVVVPVYNAEKYITKCLDSILNQSGRFEVIAVNDGSTDGSLQILKQFAAKHSNLKVIDQKNQGVSVARNAGIHAAKYKYIIFVDSDDWLEKDAFIAVRQALKQDRPDILIYNYYDVYDKQWVKDTRGEQAAQLVPEESKYPQRDIEKLALFSPFYATDALSDLYYYGGVSVIHNAFLRSFLTDNTLEFPIGITTAEDLIFMYRALAYNPKVSILNKPVYNYHNRTTSAAKSLSVLEYLLQRIEYMRQTTEYQKFPRHVQMWIDDSFINSIFLSIANLQRHGVPLEQEIDKIYSVYKIMFKYNQQELKSARHYQRVKSYFQRLGLNRPL